MLIIDCFDLVLVVVDCVASVISPLFLIFPSDLPSQTCDVLFQVNDKVLVSCNKNTLVIFSHSPYLQGLTCDEMYQVKDGGGGVLGRRLS